MPIYDLKKKAKKFKWTEEAEKAFNEIKKLLINPPILKVPTPDRLFRLESDTSTVHDPSSCNCAVFMSYTCIIFYHKPK